MLGKLAVSMTEEKNEDARSAPFVVFSGNEKTRNLKFQNYLDDELAHLSPEERRVIKPALVRYSHIFHDDEDTDFEST
jgi:hypothetical protein